jgi:hypothetical protein
MALKDRILSKIVKNYLSTGQLAQLTGTVTIGLIHKVLGIHESWKVVNYFKLRSGSLMKYLGTVNELKLSGEIPLNYSVFELINPVTDQQISSGDTVVVNPSDRQFFAPAPSS